MAAKRLSTRCSAIPIAPPIAPSVESVWLAIQSVYQRINVRFGSKADRVMSALPPKADIGTRSRHVRFGSKADNRMPRKTAAKSLGLYGVYIIGTNRKPCRLNEHDADFFSASRNHVRAGADVSATEDMNDEQDNPVAGGGRCRCGVWRDAVACDATTTPDDPRRGFGRSSRRQLAG